MPEKCKNNTAELTKLEKGPENLENNRTKSWNTAGIADEKAGTTWTQKRQNLNILTFRQYR